KAVESYLFENGADLTRSVLKKTDYSRSGRLQAGALDLIPAPAFEPGALTLVCSMPSQGKSAYLANIALELQAKKRNAAIFLPDSDAEEFILKALCASAGVSYYSVIEGRLTVKNREAFMAAAGRFSRPGLYFSKNSIITAETIAASVEHLQETLKQAGQKLDAVLVDSLNYIKPEPEHYDDPLEVLHGMAKKLQVSVICTFGARETPNTIKGRIELGDLRLAGIDERFTDQVLCLHRPEYYDRADPSLKNVAQLNRVYPQVTCYPRPAQLVFNHEWLRFEPFRFVLSQAAEEQIF
ncbi:MAG: hypothetical protein NTY45_00510, partial [Elusimicrobia bacterium]|nr:hypothetical protein [Elusimicrobiota bacterium]